MGFKDGTANPDVKGAALMNRLVWAGAGEPGWAAGAVTRGARHRMLSSSGTASRSASRSGCSAVRKDTGAPLTGNAEFDTPAFATDPTGDAIPLTRTFRVANPRNAGHDSQRMLRGGSATTGRRPANGNLDMGLIFSCYQQDLDRQFVTCNAGWPDEPLVDYISPTGGGYFFALPGYAMSRIGYGSGLLA